MAHDSKKQSPQSVSRTSTRPSSGKINPAAQVFTPASSLSAPDAGMQVPVVGKPREVIEEEDIGCPLCDEGLWCPMCGKEDKINPTPVKRGVPTLSQAAAASHDAVASKGKQGEQGQDFPPDSWPAVKQRIEKWPVDADGVPGAQ